MWNKKLLELERGVGSKFELSRSIQHRLAWKNHSATPWLQFANDILSVHRSKTKGTMAHKTCPPATTVQNYPPTRGPTAAVPACLPAECKPTSSPQAGRAGPALQKKLKSSCFLLAMQLPVLIKYTWEPNVARKLLVPAFPDQELWGTKPQRCNLHQSSLVLPAEWKQGRNRKPKVSLSTTFALHTIHLSKTW